MESAQAGLVVPPENPEALAEATRRLADNPEIGRKLGENSRKYVEDYLSWPALVTDWVEQLARSSTEHAHQATLV